jgi:hypothetical protein
LWEVPSPYAVDDFDMSFAFHNNLPTQILGKH